MKKEGKKNGGFVSLLRWRKRKKSNEVPWQMEFQIYVLQLIEVRVENSYKSTAHYFVINFFASLSAVGKCSMLEPNFN